MNRFFKSALAALPLVMLASCSEDDLAPGAEIAKNSETRYLKVTLSSPNASPVSRAWNEENTGGENGTPVVGGNGFYADGTEDENKIRTLEFYFYDSDKQFHSYVPMTISNPPVTPDENPRPTQSPNISGFYHCNVPVELVQGQTLPRYVICIVNSVEGTVYQGSTMADAQKKILNDIYGAEDDKGQFFGMSNSVYYGNDPVTGEEGVLIMAAPFTTDKLLTESQLEILETQAEDKTATNRNEIENYTINIPVERYAAKVKLDLSSLATEANLPDYQVGNSGQTTTTTIDGKAQTTYVPIALKFTPKRWSANATERTFYFLKSFRTSADVSGSNPEGIGDRFATEAELNSILFTGWNNAAHKRCFWARTPGYYKDSYPLTSDDVIDNTNYDASGNPVYPKDENGNYVYPFDLWYRSWNECAEVGAITAEGSNEYAEYVMETTMKKTRLTGEDMPDQYLPTASLPSVILLGQYEVGEAPVGTDFYLYGKAPGGMPVIYSGDEPIEGTKNIKEQMLYDQTIVLYYDEDDDKYKAVNNYETLAAEGADKASFVVEHPKESVRKYAASTEAITGGQLHVAADIAVLQLKEVPANLHFFNPVAGAYQPINSDNLTYVNLLLFQNLGGAHFYKDGMAYFTAPIQHWGWYRSDNPNRFVTETNEDGENVPTDKLKPWTEWDWTAMKTGDFGVVRNHVYTMKIGSIKGLGTAISDPDDPIVPPSDKVKYAVHFHVNIQRWAVLPTQEWNW